ncbi:MAG: hypothetical protein ACRDUA_11225, partial [Micromonosporaceae bacterium]
MRILIATAVAAERDAVLAGLAAAGLAASGRAGAELTAAHDRGCAGQTDAVGFDVVAVGVG